MKNNKKSKCYFFAFVSGVDWRKIYYKSYQSNNNEDKRFQSCSFLTFFPYPHVDEAFILRAAAKSSQSPFVEKRRQKKKKKKGRKEVDHIGKCLHRTMPYFLNIDACNSILVHSSQKMHTALSIEG